jgi:universal stress protein E
MRPIRRILVAIKDPSARSFPALDKAIQLARGSGAEIELFHAIATHVYTSFGIEDEHLEEVRNVRIAQTLARLEALAERGREQRVTVRTAAEWDYPPHEAIVRQAMHKKADLIVAECHAGRRVAPLFMHLTDWELLRFSPVPVLLVKNHKPYSRPVLLAAVDPTHANAKPTRLDEEILSAAIAVRKTLRGSLHAMHAYVPIPDDVVPSELLDEGATKKIEARARVHARARLEKTLKGVRLGRGHRHLISRHPVNAIPEVARKVRSDIVVMGAISRSGVKRFLIGNTAERVIDDLSCDVLVVKPKEFVSRTQPRSRGMRVSSPPLPMLY